MMNILDILRNSLDYPLRKLFKWSRRGLKIKNEEKFGLYFQYPETTRQVVEKEADRLFSVYHLQKLFNASSRNNYCENLFYLEMLEKSFNLSGVKLNDRIVVADIGTSSWFYIQAYYSFFKWWDTEIARNIAITGFETDSYRIYHDLYSRYDHILAYKKDIEDVVLIPSGFTRSADHYDVITMLFPFVFIKDHREWGLPDKIFDAEKLLVEAWESLRPGGVLMVANQGEDEHKRQKEMFKKCGIKRAVEFRHESETFKYQIPRFVLTAIRDGS